MKQCIDWDYRLVLNTAEGYFRAVIRRHPTEECWSWAVEWNGTYRLVGYFGNLEAGGALFAELPQLEVNSILEGLNRWIRRRVEQPLAEEDDTLFVASAAVEA